jgi:hypothetical protein
MKNIFTTFLSFVCAIAAFAQTGTLEVQLTDLGTGNAVAVEGVTLEVLNASDEVIFSTVYSGNGSYTIPDLPINESLRFRALGGDYEAGGPQLNVSTYDMVLMSRSILGVEPFNDPYKFLGSDVNEDGKLSTLDLIWMRRVVLYIDDAFPAQPSIIFVNQDYGFNNPNDPFSEATAASTVSFTLSQAGDSASANMYVVKKGHVN